MRMSMLGGRYRFSCSVHVRLVLLTRWVANGTQEAFPKNSMVSSANSPLYMPHNVPGLLSRQAFHGERLKSYISCETMLISPSSNGLFSYRRRSL